MPNIANVSSVNTWGYLISRLNDTISFVNSLSLTPSGNTFNGSLVVNGFIQTTNLYVSSIGGSNTINANGSPGAPSTLLITTDVNFSGNVTFPATVALPQVNTGKIVMNKALANSENSISGSYGNKTRFNLVLGNGDAETGNNVGTNLYLNTYDDNGAYLTTPLFITRKTGMIGVNTITPAYNLDVTGTGHFTGNVLVGGTFSANNLTITGNNSTLVLNRNSTGNNTIQSFSNNNNTIASLVLYNVNRDSFLVSNATGTPAFVWYYQGNTGFLGIGTATPTYNLDATGTTRLNGNTLINGTLAVTQNFSGVDLYAVRTGAAGNTGAIFLGNTALRYLFYDGAAYNLPGASLSTGSITSTANTPTIVLNKTALSTEAYIGAAANTISRSTFNLADSTTETGGNNGSNIVLNVYSDAGSYLSTPFYVRRSTGFVGINNANPGYNLDVTGTGRFTSNVTASSVNAVNMNTTTLTANSLVSAPSVYTSSINGDAIYHMRNRITNGNFNIDQRNNGSAYTLTQNTSGFGMDRWFFNATTNGVVSFNSNKVSNNSIYAGITAYNHFSVTTADTGTASQHYMQQVIESKDMRDLQFGSSFASPIALSFMVRSSLTGTFGGKLANSDRTRVYGFTYTISAANTWTPISVYIPGDTTGFWDTGFTKGMYVIFDLGTTSTFSLTGGVWTTTASFSSDVYNVAVAGVTTKLLANAGATLDITNIQLERNWTVTAFEPPDYEDTLRRCSRFYQVARGYCFTGYNSAGSPIGGQLTYQPSMYATPTVTIANTTYIQTVGPVTSSDASANSILYYTNMNVSGFGKTYLDLNMSAEI